MAETTTATCGLTAPIPTHAHRALVAGEGKSVQARDAAAPQGLTLVATNAEATPAWIVAERVVSRAHAVRAPWCLANPGNAHTHVTGPRVAIDVRLPEGVTHSTGRRARTHGAALATPVRVTKRRTKFGRFPLPAGRSPLSALSANRGSLAWRARYAHRTPMRSPRPAPVRKCASTSTWGCLDPRVTRSRSELGETSA